MLVKLFTQGMNELQDHEKLPSSWKEVFISLIYNKGKD